MNFLSSASSGLFAVPASCWVAVLRRIPARSQCPAESAHSTWLEEMRERDCCPEWLLPWVTGEQWQVPALSDPPEFYYICLNVIAFLGPLLLLPAANLGNPLVQCRTLLELRVSYPGLEVLPCWWPSHVIHWDHKSHHLGMTSSSHCNLHINLHSHFLFLFCYKFFRLFPGTELRTRATWKWKPRNSSFELAGGTVLWANVISARPRGNQRGEDGRAQRWF